MRNAVQFKKAFSKLLAMSTGILLTVASISYSTNYYVDNVIGNDNNSGQGTTAALAWKTLANPSNSKFSPGDSILFKAGGVWDGQLINQSGATGTSTKPVVFDRYGTGAKPLIRGDGVGESAAIFIRDNTWFEVNNLELTAPRGTFGLKILTGAPSEPCYGTAKNLTVHNINGLKVRDAQRQYAGIVFKNGGATEGHITIINCLVYDCKYNGIEFGNHLSIPLPSTAAKSSGNRIENCKIYDCGLNGIWLSDAVNSTISNCVIYNCGLDNTQQSASTTILLRNNLKTTVQNCEIYNNKKAGIGLDFEDMSSKDCIIQYNYFHDNAGGILNIKTLTTTTASTGNVFRYNVCQNNKGDLFSLSNASNTLVHNNSIYNNSQSTVSNGFKSSNGSTNNQFKNNIIVLNSSASYGSGATWDYNCFFGTHSSSEPSDPHKIITDPQFKSAGSGSVGRSTADGYVLKATSPCINAGLLLANAGTRDFWGNPVPHNGKMNIGAYEGTDGNTDIIRIESNSIKVTGSEKTIVQIVNVKGQVVRKEKVFGKSQLNLAGLAHGVYQVSIKNKNGIKSARVIW